LLGIATAEVILGHLSSLERHFATLPYDDVCDGACALFLPQSHVGDGWAFLPSLLLFFLTQWLLVVSRVQVLHACWEYLHS